MVRKSIRKKELSPKLKEKEENMKIEKLTMTVNVEDMPQFTQELLKKIKKGKKKIVEKKEGEESNDEDEPDTRKMMMNGLFFTVCDLRTVGRQMKESSLVMSEMMEKIDELNGYIHYMKQDYGMRLDESTRIIETLEQRVRFLEGDEGWRIHENN